MCARLTPCSPPFFFAYPRLARASVVIDTKHDACRNSCTVDRPNVDTHLSTNPFELYRLPPSIDKRIERVMMRSLLKLHTHAEHEQHALQQVRAGAGAA
jgi:hypothetical protein